MDGEGTLVTPVLSDRSAQMSVIQGQANGSVSSLWLTQTCPSLSRG